VKSPNAAPLSLHMRMKNWVARECTLWKSRKNGWNVVDVESIDEDVNYLPADITGQHTAWCKNGPML